MTLALMPYLIAFLIGLIVGLSELLGRYDYAISSIFSSGASWCYIGFNGLISVLGYQASIDWNLSFGIPAGLVYWKIFVVSLMAMAILRSAFTIKVGEQNFGVGLVTIIDIFMKRAKTRLDQKLTLERWDEVGSKLTGLTYEATRNYFVTVALAILPSASPEEAERTQNSVNKIGILEVDADTKMQLLAMFLSGKLGAKLFTRIAADAAGKFAEEVKRERDQRHDKMTRLTALKGALEN